MSEAIPFNGSSAFASAGYVDFVIDGSVVGKTRQAGLLSFTRIFQAGHESRSPLSFYLPALARATWADFYQSPFLQPLSNLQPLPPSPPQQGHPHGPDTCIGGEPLLLDLGAPINS